MTGLQLPAGPQGGQDPLAGLGQRSSGRLQVLIVIVAGQDLDRVGQGRAELGRVIGPDAADVGPSVGNCQWIASQTSKASAVGL